MTTEYESVWHELAEEHADSLEILIEEETAFKEQARTLLDELEERELI